VRPDSDTSCRDAVRHHEPIRAVVHLFGGPYVTVDGQRRSVPEGSKRLLAFVALRDGRVERRHVAGTLWPVGDDGRAAGNLRSALWRLRGAGIDVLCCDKWSLKLVLGVRVDTRDLDTWADRVIAGRPRSEDLARIHLDTDALDLLPGWYDDWTILEREHLRQRLLHALESVSALLRDAGRHADAVESALAAVCAEPLRESAQRVLIKAYLAERNWYDAWRCLDAYRDLLASELGVSPSADLVALVRDGAPARTRPLRSVKLPLYISAVGVSGGAPLPSHLVAASRPPPARREGVW
jgi:DNA-binding SARP family transcriptional activator